jgi:hypothetical protein
LAHPRRVPDPRAADDRQPGGLAGHPAALRRTPELAARGRARQATAHGRASECHRLGQAPRPRPQGLPETRFDGTARSPPRKQAGRIAPGRLVPRPAWDDTGGLTGRGQARSPSELLAAPITRPSGKSAAVGKTQAGSFTPAGSPREGPSRTRPSRQGRGQRFSVGATRTTVGNSRHATT